MANNKPTIKQKKAVERMLENAGNISKSMREAGYADATAKNPSELTESLGFKALMNQMGLTEEWLNSLLKEDLEKKPQKRTEELKLAFKLKGLLNDKVEIAVPNITIVDFKKKE